MPGTATTTMATSLELSFLRELDTGVVAVTEAAAVVEVAGNPYFYHGFSKMRTFYEWNFQFYLFRAGGKRSNYRVHVSGLPPTGSWQDLKDHMREAGDVCYTDVFKDGTGKK